MQHTLQQISSIVTQGYHHQQQPQIQQQQALQQPPLQQPGLSSQQEAAAAAAQLQQRAAYLQQTMVGCDPIANIWLPHMSSQGVPAGVGMVLDAPAMAGPSQAAIMAAAALQIEDRLYHRLAPLISSQMTVAASQAMAGGAAVQSADAAFTAAPATANGSQQEQAAVQQHNVSGTNGQNRQRVGFPALSSHPTLVALAEWYYITPLADTGMTPQQLDAEGNAWRGGQYRRQRWQEYSVLLSAIDRERTRLTEVERNASRNPQRVLPVDIRVAAQKLDQDREAQKLTVCKYRKLLAAREKAGGSDTAAQEGSAEEVEGGDD